MEDFFMLVAWNNLGDSEEQLGIKDALSLHSLWIVNKATHWAVAVENLQVRLVARNIVGMDKPFDPPQSPIKACPSQPSTDGPSKGQTFSCKGSVDTTINGVDTMAQSKGRNVKKRSTSVDTSRGQVDTRDRSQRNMLTGFHLRSTLNQIVDTRDLSQGIDLPVWDSVSTHLMGRSTHSGISVT
ncbi:hypothetical protein Taro_011412 [Colocasia esculenta]|uniref:Uncharacterized protein n=1 Tax=Colocasia esculenta TaxID=4460 RepID=A0A843UG09_COLES|nr:hypothetical protein [Colocasia esculenta]